MEIRGVTGEIWRGVFTPIAEIAQQATRVSESLRRTNSVLPHYRHLRYSQFANTLSCRTDRTVTNCHYSLRNHTEERSSQRFRGGSLKSHMIVLYMYELDVLMKFELILVFTFMAPCIINDKME
jgi:hypothetical protein